MVQAPSRLLPLLLAVALAPAAAAQTVQRIVPEIGQPGDVVRVVGEGLSATDTVVFVANVGGLVGVDLVEVPPIGAGDNYVFVVVPQLGTFAKPTSVPPAVFAGSIGVMAHGEALGAAPFGFLEYSKGKLQTFGQGGSDLPGPQPRISLELSGGLPTPGGIFRPKLVDATPGQIAVLKLGFPSELPLSPLAGGTLVLDMGGPLKTQAIAFVKADGTCSSPVAVPIETLGVEVAWQWFVLQTGDMIALSVSNGLCADFESQ